MKILICTHHKAGTHWTKYVVANYLSLMKDNNSKRVDFDSVERDFFPLRYDVYGTNSTLFNNSFFEFEPVTELYWAHFNTNGMNFDYFDRVIFQYRNVFDTMVSKYHYDYKKLEKKSQLSEGNFNAFSLYPSHVKQWVKNFDYFDRVIFQCRNVFDAMVSKYHYDYKKLEKESQLSEGNFNAFSLYPSYVKQWVKNVNGMTSLVDSDPEKFYIHCYDHLWENPVDGFSQMFRHFLGDKVDNELIVKSVERSSISKVRDDEKSRKAPIVGATYVKDSYGDIKKYSFTRSGKTGQFHSYFSEEEVIKIYKYANYKLTKSSKLNIYFPDFNIKKKYYE